MIYLLIFIMLLVLCYRYDYVGHKRNKMFWTIVSFIALVLVAGLRYRIGVDSIRYESFYTYVPKIWEITPIFLEKTRWEPSFVLLMSVCKVISPDFTVFQLVHAVIINTAVFIFFYRNTRHFFFALAAYALLNYIPLNTEVLREALAVAIFLFAWEPFKRGNYLLYTLLILLAMTFHLGSTLMLFMPLMMLPGIRELFKFGKRTFFFCFGLLGIGFLVNLMFFDFIKLIAFSADVTDRATIYESNELGGNMLNFMGAIGFSIRYILYPLVAIYFIWKNKDSWDKTQTKTMNKIRMFTFMSIYVCILTIPIAIFHRFNSYFLFFSILMVSDWVFTVLKTKKRNLRLSFFSWFLIFVPLVTFQVRAQMGNENESGTLKGYMRYIPYYNRLDPQEDRDREALFRYHKSW